MSSTVVAGIGPEGSGAEAAHVAAGYASALGGSMILVFGYEPTSIGPRGGPLEDQVEAIADDVTKRVHASLAEAFPHLPITIELVRDRPVESLMRVAEEHDAQVIVVGHGGRGPLRAALLGSTTYELVHRSIIPVLVVPDQVDDQAD
jgi:nucleotide-binding universal stress UspA family protein